MDISLSALALYAATGVFSGFLAGLLGIGGGMIIVPALLWSFHLQGISPEITTHMAVGTSLASILLTSISSVRTHHQHGNVDWPLMAKLSIGLLIGSWLGAQIAHALPARALQIIIAFFALWTGQHMLRGRKAETQNRALPGQAGIIAAGGVIGTASAIFGIGGGSLSVPFLVYHGMPMQRAVGSAAAGGFPIALAGSLGFLWAGWSEPGLPAGSTGYIFWPALLGLSITSLLFANLGAHAAQRLPAAQLKRVFGVLLLAVGVHFLVGFD
jgi:hypothetical protein